MRKLAMLVIAAALVAAVTFPAPAQSAGVTFRGVVLKSTVVAAHKPHVDASVAVPISPVPATRRADAIRGAAIAAAKANSAIMLLAGANW